MQISREDLSRHYASLSDAELLAIDPKELTSLALQCYDREVGLRDWSDEIESGSVEPEEIVGHIVGHEEEPPQWLDTAATACCFQVGTGRRYAEDAALVCTILGNADIPSHVVREHQDGIPDLLSVKAPGALGLKATSVLDRDLFNAELEGIWKTHFSELSDEELFALDSDVLCAGLVDRAGRLKRAFEETLIRRKSVTPCS